MLGGKFAGMTYQKIIESEGHYCRTILQMATQTPEIFTELDGQYVLRFVAFLKLVLQQRQAGLTQTPLLTVPPAIPMDRDDSDLDPTPCQAPSIPTIDSQYELVPQLAGQLSEQPQ